MVENRAAMANRIDGEEAFRVYDHPRVLIFEKTARFDLAHARAWLTEGVDWSRVAHGLRPQDVTP